MTRAGLYRYCEQEELVNKNPAINIRRPKIDNESRTLGLDRNELGAFLVQAGPRITTRSLARLVTRDQRSLRPTTGRQRDALSG